MGFHHLIARLGRAAKMPFAIHPHTLRHACGFKLANDGHDTRSMGLPLGRVMSVPPRGVFHHRAARGRELRAAACQQKPRGRFVESIE
jgi:hypothetical protein